MTSKGWMTSRYINGKTGTDLHCLGSFFLLKVHRVPSLFSSSWPLLRHLLLHSFLLPQGSSSAETPSAKQHMKKWNNGCVSRNATISDWNPPPLLHILSNLILFYYSLQTQLWASEIASNFKPTRDNTLRKTPLTFVRLTEFCLIWSKDTILKLSDNTPDPENTRL